MTSDEALFFQIRLNTRQRAECSPEKPPAGWCGITIRAPSRVVLRSGQRSDWVLPLCGYFRTEKPVGAPPANFVLHARSHTTGVVHRGEIKQWTKNATPRPERPRRERPRGERKHRILGGGFFNPNVTDHLELPEQTDTYDLWVELRDHASNKAAVVVEMDTTTEPDA